MRKTFNQYRLAVFLAPILTAAVTLFGGCGGAASTVSAVGNGDDGNPATETTAPATTAAPSGGTYDSAQLVTLTCDDGGGSGCAATLYTINSDDPTTSSPVYTNPITVDSYTQLRYFSIDNAGNAESVKTEIYKIVTGGDAGNVDETPPATTADPAGGTYDAALTVTLTCVDDDAGCAVIHYTADGSDPSESSAIYKGAITIDFEGTTVIKFFSIDNAGNRETVKTETYEIVQALVLKGIAGGWGYTLALKSNGAVWAWGYNQFGQLGDGTVINSDTPVQVLGVGGIGLLTDVASISAGWRHSLAVKNDGTLWTWGDNSKGQLGNGTLDNSDTPVQVCDANATVLPCSDADSNVLTGVVAAEVGAFNAIALKDDGTIWAWGEDQRIPMQGVDSSLSPIYASTIAAGGYHALALDRDDGTIWALGNNDYGQIGTGDDDAIGFFPKKVLGELTGVTAVSSGRLHSLALRSDGTVWAWGDNSRGQLGAATIETCAYTDRCSTVPLQVGITNVIAITGSRYHSLALKNDGTVWAWGSNQFGQLGAAAIETCNVSGTDYPCSTTPVRVTEITDAISLGSAMPIAEHSFAMENSGTIWAWGRNNYGELGDGTKTDLSTPVEVNPF